MSFGTTKFFAVCCYRLSKTMESRSESPVKSDTEPKAVQGSEQKQEGVNLTDGDKGLINIQQVRGMKTSDLTDHPGNKKTKEVLFCQVHVEHILLGMLQQTLELCLGFCFVVSDHVKIPSNK